MQEDWLLTLSCCVSFVVDKTKAIIGARSHRRVVCVFAGFPISKGWGCTIVMMGMFVRIICDEIV